VHNLELLLAGVTGATLSHWRTRKQRHRLAPDDGSAREIQSARLRGADRCAELRLVLLGATPIDVIESSRIGSRPARRTAKRTLADLRAIPVGL
jgi:phosphoenolpyruvate carboxylase